MLVLTRKASERIRIGRDVVVTVVRIEGNKVRLGIEAPAEIEIAREELPRELAQSSPSDIVVCLR